MASSSYSSSSSNSNSKMKIIHETSCNDQICICALPHSMLPPYATFGAIITVTVGRGPNPTTFPVHAGILAHASPVFREALSTDASGAPKWLEGRTQTLSLPEEDPTTIAACVSYLYTRRLWSPVPDHSARLVPLPWETLTRAAIFATMYDMPGLHNRAVTALVDAVVQRWPHRPDVGLIGEVYANTPAGSPLRRVFLHLGLLEDRDEMLDAEDEGHGFPADFWRDVAAHDDQLRVLAFDARYPPAADARGAVPALVLVRPPLPTSFVYARLRAERAARAAAARGEIVEEDAVMLLESREQWVRAPVCALFHVGRDAPAAREARREGDEAYRARLSWVPEGDKFCLAALQDMWEARVRAGRIWDSSDEED